MSLDEKAWQDIRLRIVAAAKAAHRDPGSIRVLAVSKSFPIEAIQSAYAMGQRAFGENYVQEARPKIAALSDLPGIEWHLIGPLQSNKTRIAGELFQVIETVDSEKLAHRLNQGATALEVMIEVKLSEEESKAGAAAEALPALIDAILDLQALSAERLRDMGENGRRFYESQLSMKNGVSRFEAIFRSVANSRNAHRPKNLANPIHECIDHEPIQTDVSDKSRNRRSEAA